MTICTSCHSNLVYTQYIRFMKYNKKAHRSKQQFIPMSLVCLDCKTIQWVLTDETISTLRRRREDQLSDTTE